MDFNRGVGYARTLGFTLLFTEYFAIIDADDIWESPNAIEEYTEPLEPVEPEEPAYDIVSDLKLIRASASAEGDTVTITVTPGKTMAGVYVTTASGATVEIKDANGIFADRTDAYVAYKTSNTANVEGVMVVTLADGTVYEYNVIFDIGL